MKARKYKISKKPLNGVKENTSDHITDTVSYTAEDKQKPYVISGTLINGKYIEDGRFEIMHKIVASLFENTKEVTIKPIDYVGENQRNYNWQVSLQEQLNQALENEDYERAAELRDKIKKLK